MRAIARRAVVALTLAIGLAAAFAGQALADPPDRFEPPVVAATLPAGGSLSVNKILHLTGLPAKADIIVAIDATSSMGAALLRAQADAVQICTDVQTAIPGARFAAVEFEDYPFSPYGIATDDPYELRTLGYTADCATFSAGVAAMVLGNGNDLPESNNRVHFEAYSDPALLGTRDPQASRFLVMLADNVPHSVASFGACPSTSPFSDPGRDNINNSGGGDDIETPAAIAGLNADNHTLLYISYNRADAHPCHSSLATATGGVAVPESEADDIGAFIIDQAAEVPYTVDLQISAGCLLGITFSPAPPYGPFTGPSHPTFTETITAPTLPGNYTCTVTAVMNPGGPTTAIQTINITVVAGPPATLTLDPPADVNTVGAQHCVTATVRDAFGNPVPGATVQFTVTGANTASGTAVTNSSGQAQFCYTGVNPGLDTITAQVPGTTARGVATKTWVLPALDHFKCYDASPPSGGGGDDDDDDDDDGDNRSSARRIVTLEDQFGIGRLYVNRANLLCNPVNKNGEGINQPLFHLVGYGTEPIKRTFPNRRVEVRNQFGTQILSVRRPDSLLVPSSKSIPPAQPGPAPFMRGDHFQCYPVGGGDDDDDDDDGGSGFKQRNVVLTDQFGRETVRVLRPTGLCNPAEKNNEGPLLSPSEHLTCFAIKAAKFSTRTVVVRNQFGVETLRVPRAKSLCVPSSKRVLPPKSGGDDDDDDDDDD